MNCSNSRGYAAGWFPSWMMWHHPYGYYVYRLNNTLPAENKIAGSWNSTTKYPVLCFCHNYGVCGCDNISHENESVTNSIQDTIKWNTSYAVINGTEYSLLNGTLANGTTAPGGTENDGPSVSVGSIIWVICVGIGVFLLN